MRSYAFSATIVLALCVASAALEGVALQLSVPQVSRQETDFSSWSDADRKAMWERINMDISTKRRNLSTNTHKNQMVKTYIKDFACSKTYYTRETREALEMFSSGSHAKSLQTASGIDLLITKQGKVDWNKFSRREKKYFASVQSAMQYLFYADACATFYNTNLQIWTTCCKLGEQRQNKRKTRDFVFCGSNMAMNLPIPCRSPEKKFDFGVRSATATAGISAPTIANTEGWACPDSNGTSNVQSNPAPASLETSNEYGARRANVSASTPKKQKLPDRRRRSFQRRKPGSQKRSSSRSGRQNGRWRRSTRIVSTLTATDPKRPVTHVELGERFGSGDSLSPMLSSKFTVTTEMEFTIEVYPVYAIRGNGHCNGNDLMSICRIMCCDTVYMNSEFCRTTGNMCY